MNRPLAKSALAIRHVAFEDLGNLAAPLERQGYAIRYVEAGYDAMADDDSDVLIVLGGPIGVNDVVDFPFIRDELRLIERRIAAGRPVLGICLGSQMIARALGAKVYRAQAKEIGYAPIQLTEAGRHSALAPLAEQPVLHWHGDTFDLPQDARHLAATDICPHQAFAWGPNDRVLALQFHPEVTARGLERWLIGHSGELASAGLSVASLRQAAARHSGGLESAAETLLQTWLTGAMAS